jgi:hypothetical protein
MWLTILLTILCLTVVSLIAVILINKVKLDRINSGLVEELLSESKPPKGSVFSFEDLEGLPEPVQRYLSKAIPEGQPYVISVRLHQIGDFRMGDRTAPWKPLEAAQYFTVDPPGFVWDASIEMAPFIPVRVVDMYKQGEGALRAKVASTVSVVDAQGSPELNSGELMRYLAETVWFPTALLPGQGVEWTPIDDTSSKAVIKDHGISVSLDFHFNNCDEVERIYAQGRFREVNGIYESTPWTGYFSDYQTRNGLLIPLEGQVEWNLPDGDLPYWRGHLDEIEHYAIE